jgi:hypothetical protein
MEILTYLFGFRLEAIFIPNGVKCCKKWINQDNSKNRNFMQKTKVENPFT